MIPRFAPTATPLEVAAFLKDVVAAPSDDVGVEEFERAFAEWLEARHALFVSSGRMGFRLILKALGLGPQDEVVVPAFTYFAIPAMARHAGCRVVYADIEPATYEMTAAGVEAVLTPATRAVVATHLFGRTCPMESLRALCEPRGIAIIEDCAQCVGGRVGGSLAGTCSTASYFTFGNTKNFSTFSGGMVVTDDDDAAARMRAEVALFSPVPRGYLVKQGITAAAMFMATRRALFNLFVAPVLHAGRREREDLVHRTFEEAAHVVSEEELLTLSRRPGRAQAAAGMRQLRVVETSNIFRRERGNRLLGMLEGRGVSGLPARAERRGDHLFVSFAIRRPGRLRFGDLLRRHGTDFSPGYMAACSALPQLGGRAGLCPAAERVGREIIHLPLYPNLSDGDLERIADAVVRSDREVSSP